MILTANGDGGTLVDEQVVQDVVFERIRRASQYPLSDPDHECQGGTMEPYHHL